MKRLYSLDPETAKMDLFMEAVESAGEFEDMRQEFIMKPRIGKVNTRDCIKGTKVVCCF